MTLKDIEKFIIKGLKVQIFDVETDKDITSEILTQILLEKGGFAFFPIEILEHLIKMNDTALNSQWGQFMGQSFKLFLQMQNDLGRAYKKFFAAFAAK